MSKQNEIIEDITIREAIDIEVFGMDFEPTERMIMTNVV